MFEGDPDALRRQWRSAEVIWRGMSGRAESYAGDETGSLENVGDGL
jgi:hypothetical protein